jgi:hypothetical protein
MAIDLVALRRTAYATFYETLVDYTPSWRPLTAPIMMEDDEYSLEEQEYFGTSLWESHSASPTSQDIDSENHTTTRTSFDFFQEISMADLELNPGWAEKQAVNAANAAGLTLSKAFWDAVFTADSTSHPFTGAAVFNSLAINCVDSFTIKPPQGADTPGGATITQSNEYSLSFGDAAVTSMIADRAEYFDLGGNPVEANPGVDAVRPWMIVNADNQAEAKRLARQMGPLYDGTGIQEGQGDTTEGVVVPFAGSTTSRWALWYRREERTNVSGQKPVLTGPIAPIVWGMPRIRIVEQDKRNYVSILGLGHWGIRYSAQIDRDLQLSTV